MNGGSPIADKGPVNTVAIAGTGLIGASFGLALKSAGFSGVVAGVGSKAATTAALAIGAIDRTATIEEAAAEADLLYLARPIGGILEMLPRLAAMMRPGLLVTDAGSTKFAIAAAASSLPPGAFLGGHPMAGKEVSGAEHAEASLFTGRPYLLTPRTEADMESPPARWLVTSIQAIGALPFVLSPAEHDATVALTSHLPQLASTALCLALSRTLGAAQARRCSGPGLLDATRLGQSPFHVWKDILATNAVPIEGALAALIAELETLRSSLQQDRMEDKFQDASSFASNLRLGSN